MAEAERECDPEEDIFEEAERECDPDEDAAADDGCRLDRREDWPEPVSEKTPVGKVELSAIEDARVANDNSESDDWRKCIA